MLCLAWPGAADVLAAQNRSKRPNVLFIAIDDLRTELGCYGVADAHSPHLDRLAARSVLFRNHFVQVPTCGASRYALLTGRSPAKSGVTANNQALYRGPSALKPEPNLAPQTMPELFRRNGYRTVCIGKISHTPDGKVYEYDGRGDGRAELPHAWDELATPYGEWKRGWGTFFAYAGGRHREDGSGYQPLMEFVAEDDDDLTDGMMAETAVEKLRALSGAEQPFFLGLGFFKPHLPFVATRGDWDAMMQVDVASPEHPEPIDSPYWHKSGEFHRYAFPFPKTQPLAPQDRIAARRAYLACVRYVDRQVGRVLDALDELGLRESTIVVVWGDHGWHLGETAIWGKHSPYERALRSTLIVHAPGVSQPGLTQNALVETLDLYPTLVELCDLPNRDTAHPWDGRSLATLLTEANESIRDAAVSYWRSSVSVRTKNHRLIATRKDGQLRNVELYDLAAGPDPTADVSADAPEVVERLLKYVPVASR